MQPITIQAKSLGSQEFKADYNVDLSYIAGAMYKGIASKELVVRMGQSGLLGFLGTGGMSFAEVESAITQIQGQLSAEQAYGMNLLCHLDHPEMEEKYVDLYLKHGIKNIEAAAFMKITPALVKFRLKGIHSIGGVIHVPHKVIAKISRPEVAKIFMSPPPDSIVSALLAAQKITEQEAELSKFVPMAHDICVESDSGGHTDQRNALALFPAIVELRDEMMKIHQFTKKIRVGAAGGIGTPQSAAAMYIMGADFILTGSINQCTVEAGTSDVVKDILQDINVQDTAIAPAGDMFEIGAKVQVLKKGILFPTRANHLFELYRQHHDIADLDVKLKERIQTKYFQKNLEQVWDETKTYYEQSNPNEIIKAQQNPKHKMALIFKWYFANTTKLALNGNSEKKINFQIHTGPALGAFNQWVKGTELENWRNRHVDKIGILLMQKTAELLEERINKLLKHEKRRNT